MRLPFTKNEPLNFCYKLDINRYSFLNCDSETGESPRAAPKKNDL